MSWSLVLLVCAAAVVLIAVGIVGLGFPERIQMWMLNSYAGASGWAKWIPFLGWMQTSTYLVSLRIIGGFAILMGGVLLYAVARGIWPSLP